MWCILAVVAAFVCSPGNAEAAGEEPPYIMDFIQRDLVNPGDVPFNKDLKLPCKATGGNLNFKWQHNGVFIDPIKPPYEITSAGTLIKRQPIGGDSTYQCFVNNSKGSIFSRKLKVIVTEIPKFIAGKDEVMDVTLGKKAILTCPPRDKVGFGVEYSWQNSISYLTENERRVITPKGDMYIMYVIQEDIDDIHGTNGMRCRMSGARKYKDSHSINVKVVGQAQTGNIKPSFFWPPLNNESAVAGREKTLLCIATGRPVPVITWKKDGVEITATDESFIIQRRRMLILTNIKKEVHQGTYVCEAKAAGSDKIETYTTLKVKVPPYWSTGRKPERKITIMVDGNGTLNCPALGDPAPVFTWYKNANLIKSSEHVKLDGDTLHFINIQMYQDGVYQCLAENEVGMIVASTWVNVKVKEPKFMGFGPFYMFRNSTSTLECDPDGAPAPTVVWTRKGSVIKTEGRYQLKDDGRLLVITDVVDEDMGEYTCTATNVVGSDTDTGTAKILDRTEIVVSPIDVYMVLGKPFYLRCEAKADTSLELRYKWFKDGAELKYNSRVMWRKGPKTLTVSDARPEDVAEYFCLAYTPEPKKSEDRKSAIVSIRGAPNPPSSLTISDCFDLLTELQWIPGDSNNASITYYIVEQEDASKPNVFVFHSNVIQPSVSKVTLMLTPWAVLRFRMRAVNSLGTSRPSKPTTTECKTKQQAPYKYPDNLKGVPKKADELDIMWKPLARLEQNAPGCRYVLKYRKQGVTKWNIPITDLIVEWYRISNPGYYEMWEFQIQAVNNVGPGPFSPIVTSRSGQDAPKNKPTNLEKGDVTAYSIDLSWNRVTVTRGNTDGYRIYYWTDSRALRRKRREIGANADSTDVKGTDEARQKTTLRGLKPFTSYGLSIVAYNSGGEGPESEEITFRTLEDVPADVKVYTFGKYILVTWAPPVESGIFIGYELGAVKYQNIHNMSQISRDIRKKPNEFRALLSNMEYKTKYAVEIAAKTKIGPGPPVRTLDNTIGKSAPATPRAPIVEHVSSESVNVTFLFGLKKGGYPEEFKVLYREKLQNEKWKETEWINHLDTQWVKIGSLNNALYEFKTVGRNEEGESLQSTTVKGPRHAVENLVKDPIHRSLWFIVLLTGFGVLLLVLLVVVFQRMHRRVRYPVGKRERGRAVMLEDQLDQVCFRTEEIPPPCPNGNVPLHKSKGSDSDSNSLDEYGERPEFDEDGSLIREYGHDKDDITLSLDVDNHSGLG